MTKRIPKCKKFDGRDSEEFERDFLRFCETRITTKFSKEGDLTMRLYEYSELEPGMTLAVPLYGKDRLLLNSDVVLTIEIIRRLPGWGIYFVLIQKPWNQISRRFASGDSEHLSGI